MGERDGVSLAVAIMMLSLPPLLEGSEGLSPSLGWSAPQFLVHVSHLIIIFFNSGLKLLLKSKAIPEEVTPII